MTSFTVRELHLETGEIVRRVVAGESFIVEGGEHGADDLDNLIEIRISDLRFDALEARRVQFSATFLYR
jgi:hypothetical protein